MERGLNFPRFRIIKTALGIQNLPTEEQLYEDRIGELFEAWMVDKNFTVEHSKILRLVKGYYVANRTPIDASIFNEPLFQAQGGLNRVLQIFGEDELKITMEELNQKVFA